MYPVGSVSHVGPVCSSCCVAGSSAVNVVEACRSSVTVSIGKHPRMCQLLMQFMFQHIRAKHRCAPYHV